MDIFHKLVSENNTTRSKNILRSLAEIITYLSGSLDLILILFVGFFSMLNFLPGLYIFTIKVNLRWDMILVSSGFFVVIYGENNKKSKIIRISYQTY